MSNQPSQKIPLEPEYVAASYGPGGNPKIVPRHRKVFDLMQQGMGISPAMRAAGYPATTAHQTDKLVNSDSWQALMEEFLPESLLTRRHNELLNKRETSTRVVGKGKNAKVEVVDLGPDTTAVKAALDMGYKLRGRFQADKPQEQKKGNVYNLFYMPQVQQNVRAFEDQLKHAMMHGGNQQVIEAAAPDATPAEGPREDQSGGVEGAGNTEGGEGPSESTR